MRKEFIIRENNKFWDFGLINENVPCAVEGI